MIAACFLANVADMQLNLLHCMQGNRGIDLTSAAICDNVGTNRCANIADAVVPCGFALPCANALIKAESATT